MQFRAQASCVMLFSNTLANEPDIEYAERGPGVNNLANQRLQLPTHRLKGSAETPAWRILTALSLVLLLIIYAQASAIARKTASAAAPAVIDKNTTATFQLYFATTRLNEGTTRSPKFGPNRHLNTGEGSMEYGIAGIHEPTGLVSPARAKDGHEYKKLLRQDADGWRKQKFSFLTTTDDDSFFKKIHDWDGPISIYIHGYDKPFEEAVEDAAMLYNEYQEYDPQRKFLPVLFSWPSVGFRTEYGTDEANLEWSTDSFDAFLDRLLKEKSESSTIDLVAHSMGARLIYWYLNKHRESHGPLFRNLFLCSADVDYHTAEEKKKLLEDAVTNKVYIFVSDRDKPLILSQYLHSQPRLGRPIDPPKFTRQRSQVLTTDYLLQLTTDTGDLLLGNDFTEPTDVRRWINEKPSLSREFGEKSRFIDVTNLVTKDFGHGVAFPVVAALMAGQKMPQLKSTTVHKRPDRTTLLLHGGKPKHLYKFLRLEPKL